MKVVRLGGVNPTTSRFLDLVSLPEIEKVNFIIGSHESHYFDDFFKTAAFFGEERLLEKIEITIVPKSFSKTITKRFSSLLHSSTVARLAGGFFNNLLSSLKYDFLWIGDNDFDGSNFILPSLHPDILTRTPIIRSYKETRFTYKWEELYTLANSDCLIFPAMGYDVFFNKLYQLKLKKRIYLDLDWRYSKTIEWVKKIPSKKYSSIDNIPHICIVCGRALSDTSEKRSGFRYYYYELIEQLVKRGIHVHLHALNIIPKKTGENPYAKLASSCNLFSIEKPLLLQAGSTGYSVLKHYDYGILHLPVPETEKALFEFQKINIPNRLFEYQMAGVIPIAPREETVLCNMIEDKKNGILYNNYDELANEIFRLNNNKVESIASPKIYSFKDFSLGMVDFVGGLIQ